MLATNLFYINFDFLEDVADLVPSWKKFCDLPSKEKEKFSLAKFETDYADPGYTYKNPKIGSDEKEYFHITSNIISLYNMVGIAEAPAGDIGWDFIRQCLELHKKFPSCLETISFLFADNFDLQKRIYEEMMRSKNILTLRFLKYPVTYIGKELIRPHPDKNGITIHLYCSHPGLEYAVFDQNNKLLYWQEMEILKQSAAPVYTGAQIEWFSKGQIKPLIHRAVQTETTEPRYTVVLFIPFVTQPRFSKDLITQNRMAELGYNL